MPDDELPHRRSSSRQTTVTNTHAIHSVDDGKYKQGIRQSDDPKEVLQFMQNLVEWYESDVQHPEELQIYAEVQDSGYVYIRDRQGGEWVMWSVNEWVAPKPEADFEAWNKRGTEALNDEDTGINEHVIQAVINAIVWAYEEPSSIKEQFNRMQIETCN